MILKINYKLIIIILQQLLPEDGGQYKQPQLYPSPKKMNHPPDQELYDAFQMLRLRRIGAEVLSRHPLRAEATFEFFLYGSDERAEIEILESGYIPPQSDMIVLFHSVHHSCCG